jgi:hypothetical protein
MQIGNFICCHGDWTIFHFGVAIKEWRFTFNIDLEHVRYPFIGLAVWAPDDRMLSLDNHVGLQYP